MSLHQAVERAGFGIYIPARVPDGWRMRVYYSEEDERRRWHGPLSIWEPDEGERGMPRIAMLEIAGTRIQISTDDLDADAIARLAASLVPAPADPPATP